MNKTTVIHHSADYDGIFCREIAAKFLPDAELIGWDFTDNPINHQWLSAGGTTKLYVMDLPLDRPFGFRMDELVKDREAKCCRIGDIEEIIWIDHHKSSIESHPSSIPGYRIDGVAACRLAWQWFTKPAIDDGASPRLPQKQDYVDREVHEPLAVCLAGEYDIWNKLDPRADTLQYGLRCANGELDWKALLAVGEPGRYLESLLEGGAWAQRYAQKTDADLVTHRSYRMKWEGLDFLALNTGRFNSLTFAALDKPDTGHDALLGYMFNGKVWTVSLYHAAHRTDLDLSEIAKRHGGGGHRGACGFTCDKLPFIQ